MKTKLPNSEKEKLSAFGQDNFSNSLLLICENKKLWRVVKICNERSPYTGLTKPSNLWTLTNRPKIKSEFVRFNFIE